MLAAISRFEKENGAIAVPPLLPRSFGAIDLEFHQEDGASRARRVYQQGVLRARFPNVARGAAPEAVLINTAGGLTGGDCLTVLAELGEGTRTVLTTQAYEKVYRSVLGDASVIAELRVRAGAALDWLPQPTILFNRACLRRQTNIELANDAVFLGVEAVIFGRTAMSETVTTGALSDSWTIRRGGRLIHSDRFEIAGDVATRLAQPSVLDGHAAMATIRYVAPDAEARLSEMRELLAEGGAASAWNGMLLARIVARDGYNLSIHLARVLTGLRRSPLPPVWTI
jgi:urease accessory protein